MFGIFKKRAQDEAEREGPIPSENIRGLWVVVKEYEVEHNALPGVAALASPCVKCGSPEKKNVAFISRREVPFDKYGGAKTEPETVFTRYGYVTHRDHTPIFDPALGTFIVAVLVERLRLTCADCGYVTTTKTADAKQETG